MSSTQTVLIGGTPASILAGSLVVDGRIQQKSTCSFVLLDPTGTNIPSQNALVQVNDSVEGEKFSGYVDSVDVNKLYPQPNAMHTVQCKDKRYIADKRLFTSTDYVNRLSGDIAIDLIDEYLAQEGVTPNFAIDHVQAGTDFAAGTLTNLSTANNDLELALAGTTYTKTESTSSDWIAPGSTLVGTYYNGPLTLFPNNALHLHGVSQQGQKNNYAYVKIWNGSVAIASGDTLRYFIWISSTSPAIVAGVDGICSDGTTFRAQAIYDQQGLACHPGTDLSGYADDKRYYRQIDLTTPNLTGKTLSSIEIVLEGDANGTYDVYFDTIQLFNSGGGLKQTFYTNSLQMALPISDSGYSGVTVTQVTTYTNPGYRLSPAYSLSGVGLLQSSTLSWDARLITPATATTPQIIAPLAASATGANKAAYVLIEASIDGGLTWQTCTSLQPVPNLRPGMNLNGISIQFRQTLNVGGPDPTVTPALYSMTFTALPTYQATKTDVIQSYDTQTQWNSGTNTNTVSDTNGNLTLTGARRTWNSINDITSRTLFGSNPVDGVTASEYYLRCDATYDARARLDFVGSLGGSFTAEVDALLGDPAISNDNTGNYGIEYCTTNWNSSTNNGLNSYAYVAYFDANGVHLDKGGNGTSGSPTSIASYSFGAPLSTGQWYRLKVIVNGNTHVVYLNDVPYISTTDNTYTGNGGKIGIRHYNSNASGRHSGYFNNFGMVPSLTGQWVSPNTSLSSVGTATDSQIAWTATTPNNGTLLVESSIDGGTTYQTCTNGQPIPQLPTGTSVSVSTANLRLRATLTVQNANVTPSIGAMTATILGAYTATGTRISPSLPLTNVGRVGSTSYTWNENAPAGTSVQFLISTDNGATYTDTTSNNGGTIPNINVQPDPSIDNYAVFSQSSYTSTNYASGTNATWTDDLSNSRLIATGGTNGLYLWNQGACADGSVETITNQAEFGGLVFRFQDTSNFYFVTVRDDSALSGANTLTLTKRVAGTNTPLGTAPITFVRGSYHDLTCSFVGSTLSVLFDGVTVISATDTSLSASGSVGLLTNGGTSYWYILRAQPLGDNVSSLSLKTKVVLTTTVPSVTPSVTDITVAVRSPDIQSGQIIPSTSFAFRKKIGAALDDIAKQSNYWWGIFKNKPLFQNRQGIPAPWPLSSSNGQIINGQYIGDLQFATKPRLTRRSTLYRNRQWITNALGATALQSELKLGDGSARAWTMNYAFAKPQAGTPVGTQAHASTNTPQSATPSGAGQTASIAGASGTTDSPYGGGLDLDIPLVVNDAATAAIATGTQTVTFTKAQAKLTTGMTLIVSEIGGNTEQVTVTNVGTGGATFTATFAKTHSKNCNIINTPTAQTVGNTKLLSSITKAGVTGGMPTMWARAQIWWRVIDLGLWGNQPTSSHYDWSVVDDYITQCKTNKDASGKAYPLKCIFVLQNAADVHMEYKGCDPTDKLAMLITSDAAYFLDQLTQRYNGTGTNGAPPYTFDAIELGNEGYDDHYQSFPNCSDGGMNALLINACAPKIRANSPKTLIGTAAMYQGNASGTTNPTPPAHYYSWTQDLYGKNNVGNTTISAKGNFDYLNFHFYNPGNYTGTAANPNDIGPNDNANTPAGGQTGAGALWKQIAAKIQQAMTEAGDNVPIWNTEMGWTMFKGTNGGVSDSDPTNHNDYPTYLNELYGDAAATNSGVAKVFQYDPGGMAGFGTSLYQTNAFNAWTNFMSANPTLGYQGGSGTGTGFTVSPSSLSFAGVAGVSDPPSQSVTLTNTTSASVTWSSSVTMNSGANWLTRGPTNGTIPAGQTASVSVNASNLTGSLAPGTYTGAVNFSSGSTTLTVSVTLTVTSASGTASVSVVPSSLNFTAAQGGANPASQNVTISNTGTVSGTWTVTEANGAAWLSETPSSGTIASGKTATTSLSINTTGLTAGTYTETLTFAMTPGSTTATVSVTLTITAASSAIITATPSALTYSATVGGANPITQTVLLTNTGTVSGTWNTSPIVYNQGSGWLSYGQTTGTLAVNGTKNVAIACTITGLAVGTYTATLTFTMSGTASTVSVTLTIAASGSSALTISPTSLTMNGVTGNTVFSQSTATLSNPPSGTSGTYTTQITLANGASGWLEAVPSTGTLAASSSQTITLSANPSLLAQGNYSATIAFTCNAGTANASTAYLSVTFAVAANSAAGVPAPTVLRNGNPVTLGVAGSDINKDFYYSVGSAQLTQDPNATTLAKGETLLVTYVGQVLQHTFAESQAQQQALAAQDGTSGIVEEYEDAQGLDVPGAQALAQARINQYALLARDWTYTTLRGGLQPGMQQQQFVPEYGLNDISMLITGVKITYKPNMTTYDVVCSEGYSIGHWSKYFLGGQ